VAEHPQAGFAGVSDEDMEDSLRQALPGRACGSCSLCCVVFDIPELEKPPGEPCRHLEPGGGCAIHSSRPRTCHDFFCGWRLDPNLGPEWKPDVSGLVFWVARHYSALMITVDPARPDAWKQEPYYKALKNVSGHFIAQGRNLIVMLRGQATIILPDRDQPLGALGPGDRIEVARLGAAFSASVRRAEG